MRTKISLFIFSFLFCAAQQAQNNDTIVNRKLKEIEITAQAIPSVSQSTNSLQILTQQDILEQGMQSVSDAVRRFNGIVLKDYGGIGGLKTVSIRGMGAEHTAVSYDGVVINNVQSGQVDIGRFALDNISIVSLSIGQPDDIFQTARAFASVGVLNLQTSTPDFSKRNNKGHIQATAGSFGLFNPMVDYAQKLNNTFSLSLNGNWQRADGNYPFRKENDPELTNRKRDNSDVNIYRSEVNLYSNYGKSGQLNTKIYYFNSERGLPRNVIKGNDYAAERLWNKNVFVQTSYLNQLSSKLKLKSQAKYDYAYTRYSDTHSEYEANYGTNTIQDIYKEQEAYLSNALLYGLNNNVSVSFVQDLAFNRLNNEMAYPILAPSVVEQNLPYPKRYSSLSVLAAQYKTSRLTINSNVLMTYIYEHNQNNNPDRIFKKLLPSISLSYAPFAVTALRVRTSYKHTYRVPTFTELYYSVLEKSLKAESAKQFNLGLTWVGSIPSSPVSYINVSVDGYYNKINDKIVIIPTTFLPKSMNFGKVEMKGLDFNLTTEIAATSKVKINIVGAYSFMSAIDVTSASAKNYRDQIPYTPRQSGSVTATIKNPWVDFSYIYLASSERYMNVQNIPANRVDGYSDHSISLYKQLKLKENLLYIQGNVLNIGNQNYQIIQGYPMPGRSYKLTAGYKF